MKSCVIYATTSGNTRRVAETIAEELRRFGEAELIAVEDASDDLPLADLVLIGGPTEGHGVSKPMARYLERLDQRTLAGRAFAASTHACVGRDSCPGQPPNRSRGAWRMPALDRLRLRKALSST